MPVPAQQLTTVLMRASPPSEAAPGVLFSVMLGIIMRGRAASLGVLQGTCGQGWSEACALREGNTCAAFLLCTS